MSQSLAFDAMQVARDALELDGEAAFDAACQVVEDYDAWSFECWPARVVWGPALNLTSFDAILKQHYPPSAITALSMREMTSQIMKLGASPSVAYMNPTVYEQFRKLTIPPRRPKLHGSLASALGKLVQA
jgi:hypothetical protein